MKKNTQYYSNKGECLKCGDFDTDTDWVKDNNGWSIKRTMVKWVWTLYYQWSDKLYSYYIKYIKRKMK